MMILAACHASAPSVAPVPAVPRAEAPRRIVRPRPDTFVASYSQALADDRARLEGQGLADDLAVVRAIVDAHLPAREYRIQAAGATSAVQRRLWVDSVTNNLINYGYRGVHFANAAQAQRLIGAAAGVFGNSADGDLATFAPTVAVAELDRFEDSADGSSTLVYRVIEPIKNAPAKGAAIRSRLNGPRALSPFPPPPQPGEGEMRMPGRVVLFLSPPRLIGGVRSVDTYMRITQPMRLDGEKLTAGYHSDAPEITLTRLKAVIREQVCGPGFVAVGMGGSSLRC